VRKRILILILFYCSTCCFSAEYRSEVYYAYVNNKMEKWKSVIDRMESSDGMNDNATIELLNYQYGYIGYCLEFDRVDEAKKYFSMATRNLDKLEQSGYYPSILNSYKSAFYGFRISFNKLSAPFNGPKSLDYAEKALEQDSLNYLANIQYGYALSNMPAAFGGSKKDALVYYFKARKILEKNPVDTMYNWNYMNLLIQIGKAYTDLLDYTSAKSMYENILKIEPDFKYVKDELYPSLMKKINK
jgi:tetratricopeptide (TPR) repeat protein